MRGDDLRERITSVVANGNCSGCGACALAFDAVDVRLDDSGYMRPEIRGKGYLPGGRAFDEFCPGRRVVAPREANTIEHPVLGRYLEAFEGWATDSETRFRGSSGGVLTALSRLVTERGGTVAAAAADPQAPSRTVPIRIMNREEALAAAGSRYAPVAACAGGAGLSVSDAFVAKPCEVSALRQSAGPEERPLLLSFFCAGTPDQAATENLVSNAGAANGEVSSVRYRGNGWPGQFTVTVGDETAFSMSYEQSWGKHLGKALQWRCKVCPDGTGASADVAVGDYWDADPAGFPVFEDSAGRSVIICRTRRGLNLVREAAEAGVIELGKVDLDAVARIQPLQSDRRITMPGRFVGTVLAGRRFPAYRGFSLLKHVVRHPIRNLKAAVGTYLRVKGRRR